MANVTTQMIHVDLSTDKVLPTAFTHQNDTARTFEFSIYNKGVPYTMTGNTVKFAYKSPIVNGQYTVITGSGMESGTVSGNKVTVTLPSEYTAISGVGMLTMIITPTSGTVRPVNIKLVVQKSADGADVVSGASDFPATLGEIAEDWLEENISIQIDDTLSVSGKAADAKVTGDEISELDGQVDDLKSELSDIGVEEKASPNLLNPSDIEVGRITSSSSTVLHTGTYDTDYKTTGFMPVTSGKKYGFHATNNGNIIGLAIANVWAYNSSKAALSGGYLGSISYNSDGLSYITAPTGCAYIRASATSTTFTNYGTVMFSEVDGAHKPETIQAYGSIYVLEGYADEEKFEAVKDIIDDNFIPEYSPIEGTETTGKYIKSTGVVESIDDSNYVILEVLATPGATYKVSARGHQLSYYYAFYDSNGNFLAGLQAPSGSGTASISDSFATAPANAAKLIAEGKADVRPVIKGVSGYIPKESKPWSGKKWVCVGDSLTEANVATTKHYFEYIADRTGIDTVNMGVGGTGYVRGYDANNAFYQRISDVPTDADIVTVFGSGNDKNISAMPIFDGKTWEQALGDYTDTGTDTICGCVNTFLDNYFAVMTTVPIGIIAPTPWMNYPTTLTTENRMADYTEKLRKIAEYRGVPFLDLYHHSNLRPEDDDNRDACFYDGNPLNGNGDGVHPNALGHKIIAPKIYEFVKTLLLS